MNNDKHFAPDSRRWKRESLKGALAKQDLEALHENMHWLQHVSTGTGFLLNRMRSLRDRAIIGHLRSDRSASLELARNRILSGSGGPAIDSEAILKPLRSKPEITSHAQLATLLEYTEQAVLNKEFARHRNDDLVLIALAAYTLLKEGNEGRSDLSFGEFYIHYRVNSQDLPLPDTDRGPLSTEQLYESHAALIEQLFLRHYDHTEDADSRQSDLFDSDYNEPIVYALRIIFHNTSDAEFARQMSHMGTFNYAATLIMCLDIALDIYFPKTGDWETFSERDWFPPLRYARLVNAVKAIGFLDVHQATDRTPFETYYQKLKAAAALRTSTDCEFFHYESIPEELFATLCSDDATVLKIGTDIHPISLYSLVAGIQSMYWKTKREKRLCHLLDPALNLFNEFAPQFMNFYDSDNDKVTYFSVPLVLLYSDGLTGLSSKLTWFANFFLASSIVTYPWYAIAFEDGVVAVAPKPYADTLKFSGLRPHEMFLQHLSNWLSSTIE